jgi:hypothetical protein
MKRLSGAILFAGVLVLASQGWPQAIQEAAKSAPVREDCSKVWLTRPADIEEFLRTAPVDHMDDVGTGVTRPKRVYFAPGGLAKRAVWKPLRPGVHGGYQDSYTAEIAAYEMDKLLGLGMVPPYVERKIGSETGAVGYWVEGVKPWKIGDKVEPEDPAAWDHEIIAMKMFDLLIGNTDRNQGNLLYDVDYHMILIDHSRAFTDDKDISHIAKPTRIVRSLWEKMSTLTEADLQPAIGKWVSAKELKAVLQRRDEIGELVKKLVKDKGERMVFMK